MIVLWNKTYMEAAIKQLRKDGYSVSDEDAARLSPLVHGHINMLGRYSFTMPETAASRGTLGMANGAQGSMPNGSESDTGG